MPLPGVGKKPYRMLSIPDMALLGAAALIFFGPDQLPKVAKKFGVFMRDMQNMSQDFVREMERAADEHETPGGMPAASGYDYSNGSSYGYTAPALPTTEPSSTPPPTSRTPSRPRPPVDLDMPP